MKYTNEQGVQFSIKIEDCNWVVRYAPFWKTFRNFRVGSDEHGREVFWVLSKLKNCTMCRKKLLHVDNCKDVCETCNAMRLSIEEPRQPIIQCCVCYQELFDVLDNKVRLTCGHSICKGCCSKIIQPTDDFTWDLILGILYMSAVKCPMCRHVSMVTTRNLSLVSLPYNSTT